MGYTTDFSGQFSFDREVDAETIHFCNAMLQKDYRDADFPKDTAPAAYLQWQITEDRLHLQWDGNEKFYEYEEWLQWLIDRVFVPRGYMLSGKVVYQGEEVGDVGTLAIVDGRVIKSAAVFA